MIRLFFFDGGGPVYVLKNSLLRVWLIKFFGLPLSSSLCSVCCEFFVLF